MQTQSARGKTGRTALAALARRVMSAIEYRLAAEQLAVALEEVKVLSGLLPICSHCKCIRDDAGYLSSLERISSRRRKPNSATASAHAA
jgi:hypothetical protein